MSDEDTILGGYDGDDDSEATVEAEIGPYRLVERIGEGGMGEVWKAVQDEPVHRTVALKLIKLGMDTRKVVARFESERQALALMDHACIARVYDAGATKSGRPFFVMEHVSGEPIDDYCDRERLDTAQRLALFIRVCHGVQHAHQKGIVHRDIKPSNVLVVVEDDRPVPKIIDFGIAKATTDSLGDDPSLTQFGTLVGTPDYMSPEQAAATEIDIDSRSDVYSLGVLLYKLLVGTLPFNVRAAALRGIDEVRRTIREQEPVRPSTRVTYMGDDTAAAAHVEIDRSLLARRLRGDLDWITMRALEKDRERRYPSASELAADVDRHLRHEPVAAGPPSRIYRVGKFVRRHRSGVAAAVLVALTMSAGTVVATIGFLRATRAEVVARDQAARATREARTSREISEFMQLLFVLSDPNETRGGEITVREVLAVGSEQIRTGLPDQPAVRARLMSTIGSVYQSLAMYEPAGELLDESLRVRRELYGEDHPEYAAGLSSLGRQAYLTDDYEKALELSRQALAIQRLHLDEDDPAIATTCTNLAHALWRSGEHEHARSLYERALAIRERAFGARDGELARNLHGLALVLEGLGDDEEAERLLGRALEIQRESLGPDHPHVARTLNTIANLRKKNGDYEQAREFYEQAIAIKGAAFGDDHPEVTYPLNGLADLLKLQGDFEGARARLARVFEIRLDRLGGGHPTVADAMWQIAGVYRAEGDQDRADEYYRQALAIKTAALDPDDPALFYDRACYLAITGDSTGALKALRRALELGFAKDWPSDPDLASLRGNPEFEELVRTSGTSRHSEAFADDPPSSS